ncbi:Imm21 family immunity protein [Haloferula sp. BvORR071]|uniref:Imm21 family immunity protein n=1 Tax=Haloferula sp. BvORR071 TaxID=1396141 RepID=UPI002240FCA2|nr:Imm21 family immunity protein [Haloferula sp. BvORR071]
MIFQRTPLLALLALLSSCDSRKPAGAENQGEAPPPTVVGMSKYQYVACDGGPHTLLAVSTTGDWQGHRMIRSTDYRRASSITGKWDILPVGKGSALIMTGPPISACRLKGDPGPPDIFVLQQMASTSLDDLLDRALAATPATSFTDSGKTPRFEQADALLFFASDDPASPSYDVAKLTIAPGTYAIHTASYKGPGPEEVDVYRLVPSAAASPAP